MLILRRLEERIEPFVCFDHVSAGSESEYGSKLTDVSFEIEPGERIALIGPGDSGKTLVMRLILGLTQPESGTITVFGEEPGSTTVLQRVGAVLDSADFPPHLKVKELIDLVRAHYENPAPLEDLIEQFDFADMLDKKVSALNAGSERWLCILLSMIGTPDGVVVDSPTRGMDVGWRRQFWEMMRQFTAEGGAAIVATDVVHDISIYSTRILLLHHGRIIADGSSEEIRRRHGGPPRIKSPLVDVGLGGPGRPRTAQQVILETPQTELPGLEDVVLRLIEDQQ